MKLFFINVLVIVLAVFTFTSCTSPTKDLDIKIQTNVFKYTAVIEVKSSAGTSMDNATVTLKGKDADKIYNGEGKKQFKVTGGMILLALDPKFEPLANAPIEFSVDVTATDYLPINVPVTIAVAEKSKMISASMVNIKNLPQGSNIKTNNVTLNSNGSTAAPVTVSTTPSNGVTETVSIALPAGTQFKDAAGNVIPASSLSVSTLVASTSGADLLKVFPGGSLSLPAVKTSTGATQAATLIPAALTEISMSACGTAVKNFNQPIEIVMQLDQNFFNPNTNAVIKAGDVLDVFSYSADKGIWTFESNGTVVLSNGKLALKAATTHLTWFTAAATKASCANTVNLKFNASWLAQGITHPVSYKVFSGQTKVSEGTFTVSNGSEAALTNLPSSAVEIKYYDVEGNVLATQSLANPCNATSLQAVTLNASPLSGNPKVTMQLYVRCPNKTQNVTLLPDFYLYYKPTGAPENQFKLLGLVNKGYISTTLLNTTSVYDFKAVWGTYVKYANAKTVKVDNSATVGDGPGELIGDKAGATNLQILKEVCSQNGQ